MRLIFVRHAESIANATGRMQGHAEFDLSETGNTQAEMLYQRFRDEGLAPTHVYTSPLRRTARTASIVTRDWSVPVDHWDDLKEHGIGVFSGLTWPEIKQRHPDMARAYTETRNWDLVEGAEKIGQRRARGRRVVDTTLERHANDDTVLLFTHGGILQHMLAALMGTDRTWGVPVKNTGVFDFAIDLDHWSSGDEIHHNFYWRIDRFNDASHLDGLGSKDLMDG